ncbi:hypothetical protein HNR52_002084 [Thermoanaerobacterium thermosulfurigenes]|jgi:hypothetical protein
MIQYDCLFVKKIYSVINDRKKEHNKDIYV